MRFSFKLGNSRSTPEFTEPDPQLSAHLSLLTQERDTLVLEIDRCLSREVQNFQILVTAIAAIVASSLLVETWPTLERAVAAESNWLLAAALVAYWFPINAVSIWGDIGTAAAYLTGVLLPKINACDAFNRDLPSLTQRGPSEMYESWLLGSDAGQAGRYPEAMAWERFRSEHLFTGKFTRFLMQPIWTFRSALLFTPTLLLLGFYFAVSESPPDAVTWILFVLLGSTALFSVVALLVVGNLPRRISRPPMSAELQG